MTDAEVIVQKQVDAYNAHDLEKFFATYAKDARYIEHPSGEITIDGETDLRKQYSELFLRHPNIHVEIANRTVLGEFVIDREVVTGRDGLPVGNIIAVYQVSNGSIEKVWVIRG